MGSTISRNVLTNCFFAKSLEMFFLMDLFQRIDKITRCLMIDLVSRRDVECGEL